MGDTITREEVLGLLPRVFDEEYGLAVNREIAPTKQNHYDGAGSVAYNCGPGALKWKWAQALKAGKVAEAAERLKTTAITANGRRLAGLVRRRADEANLILTGQYSGLSATSRTIQEIKEYQSQLKTLGYYTGKVDGLVGPKTTEAVERFQRDKGLVVDGKVGPATRAALVRALDSRQGTQAAAGGTVGGGVAGGATTDTPVSVADPSTWTDVLLYGAIAAAIVIGLVLIIKYRGVLTGRRVPT